MSGLPSLSEVTEDVTDLLRFAYVDYLRNGEHRRMVVMRLSQGVLCGMPRHTSLGSTETDR